MSSLDCTRVYTVVRGKECPIGKNCAVRGAEDLRTEAFLNYIHFKAMSITGGGANPQAGRKGKESQLPTQHPWMRKFLSKTLGALQVRGAVYRNLMKRNESFIFFLLLDTAVFCTLSSLCLGGVGEVRWRGWSMSADSPKYRTRFLKPSVGEWQ